MFKIVNTDINNLTTQNSDFDAKTGAIVSFDGIVRNINDGRAVSFLEYQCYEAMSNKVGRDVLNEAMEKFDILSAQCVHRVGHLAIGDKAVWVVASSIHRHEAFVACQYIIDEVKLRVPIWKKEYFVSHAPEWVACHRCAEHAHTHGRNGDQVF